jgi:hypothetical protein
MATLKQLNAALNIAKNANDLEDVKAFEDAIKKYQVTESDIPGNTQDVSAAKKTPSLKDKAVGLGETGLALLTGATSGALGFSAGGIEGLVNSIKSGKFGTPEALLTEEELAGKRAGQLTYQPRTPAGREYTENVGDFVSKIGIPLTSTPSMNMLATAKLLSPVVSSAARETPTALINALRKIPEAINDGSTGAAATPAAIQRTVTARSLNPPVSLTLGEATRDAAQLAFEKEQLKNPNFGGPFRERTEENNLSALQNIEGLIEEIGSKSTSKAVTGQGGIDSLVAGLEKAKKRVAGAYGKAETSPEALYEVDPSPLIDYLNTRLRGVPSSSLADTIKKFSVNMGIAKKGKDGKYIPQQTTVKTLGDLYKETNAAINESNSTEVKQGALIKKLINDITEQAAGPLYQRARNSRRIQGRNYEDRTKIADILKNQGKRGEPTVEASEVFNKNILNSSPEEIEIFRKTLIKSSPTGLQSWKEFQGETMKHIRDEATKSNQTDSKGNPIVFPQKLYKVINDLDKEGKLNIIFGTKNAQKIRDINEVVAYVNTVPPGTLINNSGTSATLMYALSSALAESTFLGTVFGIPAPILTTLGFIGNHVKNNVKDAKLRKRIETAIKGIKQE